jgi:PAS domain S-box-containing protein
MSQPLESLPPNDPLFPRFLTQNSAGKINGNVNLSFKKSSFLATFIPAILAILVSAFFVLQSYRITNDSKMIQRTSEILSLSSQSVKALLDMETGMRGYLITNDQVFLEPYYSQSDKIEPLLSSLAASLAGDPYQLGIAAKAKSDTGKWMKYAEKMKTMKERHGKYSAIHLNVEGKKLMDEIRREFSIIRDNQFETMKTKQLHLRETAKKIQVGGILLSILIAVLVAWALRRVISKQYNQTLAEGKLSDQLFRRLQTITDSAPIAIIYIDKKERFIFANHYYKEHFGRGDVIGKNLRDVVGETSYSKIKPHIEMVLKGENTQFEFELTREASEPILVAASYSPSLDEQGNIEGFVIICLDITEKRANELLLKKSQESLSFVLNSVEMGTWEVNLKDNTIACSTKTLNMLTIEEDKWDGRIATFLEKIYPEDADQVIKASAEAIKSKSVYEMEFRVVDQMGKTRWLMSRGLASEFSRESEPTRFAGIVYDITERKEREVELRDAIKARDQFLSIASHELKTPLTSLQLQIQLKQRELERNFPESFTKEKLAAGFNQQYSFVHRITHLVDDILDVSRIADGHISMNYSHFDLSSMVKEVIESFEATAESKGVKIILGQANEIDGNWDRYRLEQIVLNLLTNAVRYGNHSDIMVKVLLDGMNARIVVKDEGRGIKEEDQRRVFGRFERAVNENEVSGLGLGLFISKEIAKAHGGNLLLKSEFGHGAEFTLLLPKEGKAA